MIAVLSFLSFKCLSIQFADAFKVPSSNHLILTSLVLYFTSLIFLYGLIHVILFPSFLQNSSLLFIDWEYFCWYLLLFAKLLFIHSGLVFIITSETWFASWFWTFIFFLIFFEDFFLILDLFFNFLEIFFLFFVFFFFFRHVIILI